MSAKTSLRVLLAVSVCALLATACDDPKKPAGADKAEAAAPAQTASAAPAPANMPEVTFDKTHVQIGMDELQRGVPSYNDVLKNLIAKYPVSKPDRVVLNAARETEVEAVTTVAYALFDAGAKAIEVRTKPRGTFPGKLLMTPDKDYAKKAQPCTYAGMVLKDLGVTFWHVKGGLGKRYSKGMAGPDFTAMHTVFAKEVDSCSSTLFYFSADDGVEWGHAFDLATSMTSQEPKYKLDTFILLRETPTAGKPVKLGP